MQLMIVNADGITELSELKTVKELMAIHKEKHIVFFSEGDLFIVHEVNQYGKVYGTSSNDEHIQLDHNRIECYIIVEDCQTYDLSN